jgi:hypothetical protein
MQKELAHSNKTKCNALLCKNTATADNKAITHQAPIPTAHISNPETKQYILLEIFQGFPQKETPG